MAEHTVSTRIYYRIFGILILLTLVTTGAAYIDLGPLNPAVALVIAVSKAALVVLFFMHVKYERRLTLVFVLAGFIWLAIMIGLSLSDYGSRSWIPEGGVAPEYYGRPQLPR